MSARDDRSGSDGWDLAFRSMYRLVRWLDPPIRGARRMAPIGTIEELCVTGRQSARERCLLVTVMGVGKGLYVGHPNGARAGWVRDLLAHDRVGVIWRDGSRHEARAHRLPDGDERTAVIRATARLQPFPANVVYRLGRRHILAVGIYFRLEPI